jgi:hypothetical protein
MTNFPIQDLLKMPRLPGRINAEQTAILLGFQIHDIPVLVAAKLINPLGNPSQAAPKWFSSVEVETLRNDPKFLAKATKAISSRWQKRNKRVSPQPSTLEPCSSDSKLPMPPN